LLLFHPLDPLVSNFCFGVVHDMLQQDDAHVASTTLTNVRQYEHNRPDCASMTCFSSSVCLVKVDLKHLCHYITGMLAAVGACRIPDFISYRRGGLYAVDVFIS
jgi:hypothetical protein